MSNRGEAKSTLLRLGEKHAQRLSPYFLHGASEVLEELFRMKEPASALAGMAQWIECRPANQKVTHQFNSWSGHMPGMWARFPNGGVCEGQPNDVSLPHWFLIASLPHFPLP